MSWIHSLLSALLFTFLWSFYLNPYQIIPGDFCRAMVHNVTLVHKFGKKERLIIIPFLLVLHFLHSMLVPFSQHEWKICLFLSEYNERRENWREQRWLRGRGVERKGRVKNIQGPPPQVYTLLAFGSLRQFDLRKNRVRKKCSQLKPLSNCSTGWKIWIIK